MPLPFLHRAALTLALLPMGCTAQTAQQRALADEVAGMHAQAIALACTDGPRTVAVLGAGFYLREGRRIFICTEPLAGGLACTDEGAARILDFETRRATIRDPGTPPRACTF